MYSVVNVQYQEGSERLQLQKLPLSQDTHCSSSAVSCCSTGCKCVVAVALLYYLNLEHVHGVILLVVQLKGLRTDEMLLVFLFIFLVFVWFVPFAVLILLYFQVSSFKLVITMM